MADEGSVNPMDGIGMMITGGLMMVIPLLAGEWMVAFFGLFIFATGVQKYIEAQQKIAAGANVSGQPQDIAVGAWDDVGWIMGKVDNPDTFILDIETHERSDSVQSRMDAEFHGDTEKEFRGDSVSNWSHHAPVGKPSAIPADFHDASIFWHNPTAGWTDPYE